MNFFNSMIRRRYATRVEYRRLEFPFLNSTLFIIVLFFLWDKFKFVLQIFKK